MAISAILAHRRVRATPPWGLAGAGGQLAVDGTADRRWRRLSDVLLLTGAPESSADILPSLGLLPHAVRLAPAEAASVTGGRVRATPPWGLAGAGGQLAVDGKL